MYNLTLKYNKRLQKKRDIVLAFKKLDNLMDKNECEIF